ncbi:integrase core domain-containing protein [Streptomyces sp. NPDC006458]|uniref:integrase core domain-containing protein n=1 Tax=Streptomyces sp. NPDC006458 TaxID=3154302 RepID=UPI0033B63F3E
MAGPGHPRDRRLLDGRPPPRLPGRRRADDGRRTRPAAARLHRAFRRGSEYTSDELRREADRLGLRQSMGRTGLCFDNAAAESFFALLKEEIGTRRWPDRTTARAEIFAFIETFYNRRRLRKHPAWGYLTPLETRQRHEQEHALAA